MVTNVQLWVFNLQIHNSNRNHTIIDCGLAMIHNNGLVMGGEERAEMRRKRRREEEEKEKEEGKKRK